MEAATNQLTALQLEHQGGCVQGGAAAAAPPPAPATEDVSSLLTLVITTSPLPSMPSTALLNALLGSLALTPELTTCHRILVADGIGTVLTPSPDSTSSDMSECLPAKPNYKKSRVRLCEAESYAQYLTNIRNAIHGIGEGCPLWRGTELLALEQWHGFGLAVLEAALRARTPYLLVVQHDQLMLERFVELPAVLAAMSAHPSRLSYVGLPSRTTTVGYAARMQQRYGITVQPLSVPELPPLLPLLPLLMWYDKPHVVARKHLLDFVYNPEVSGVTIKPGDFTEDVLGHHQLNDIKQNGMAAHSKYGTWVLDAERPLVYHLSGRKVMAAPKANAGAEDGISGRERSGGGAGGWGVMANSSGTASFVANIAGLGAPLVDSGRIGSEDAAPSYRFRGICFHCNQKGHSFKFCPQRGEEPETCTVGVPCSTPHSQSRVVAHPH